MLLQFTPGDPGAEGASSDIVSNLPIFPIRRNGKAPLTPHGYKDASSDPAVIARWEKKYPGSNRGMPTGEASGYVVLDIDSKSGGLESWAELQDIYGAVNTQEILTPSLGNHLYFLAPEGVKLKSTASQIAPGVDTRAEGGYAVIPPSTIDGNAYEVVNDVPPAPIPDWLLALWPKVGETSLRSEKSTGSQFTGGDLFTPLPEKQRNVGLTRVAGYLWNKCQTVQELEDQLLEANGRLCTPPLPEDEVLSIARSVSRYPKAEPEQVFTPRPDDVLISVEGLNTTYRDKDTSVSSPLHPWIKKHRDNTQPSPLWDYWCGQFPDPIGVQPLVKSTILWNEKEHTGLVADLRSNTWFNPANAAFRLRKYGFHLSKKLAKQDCFIRDVPLGDWSEDVHEALTKRIERADGKWLMVDNQLSRGCWAYLSTVPIDGFLPLEDQLEWLTDRLRGIRVPSNPLKRCGNCEAIQETEGKKCSECGGTLRKVPFRPIRGSHDMTKGSDAPVDEDKGRYELAATREGGTDWTQLEAELIAAAKVYAWLDPVYRAQVGQGIQFSANSVDEVRDLASYLGYNLRRGTKSMEGGSDGI